MKRSRTSSPHACNRSSKLESAQCVASASAVEVPAEGEDALVEEIVTVEETQTILVRFPFLDFFRNAHVCEMATDRGVSDNGGGANTRTEFAPHSLVFKEGTLETSHPVVLLKTLEHGEMEFEGSWCDVHRPTAGVPPMSNRVIVHLSEKGSGLGGAAKGGNYHSQSTVGSNVAQDSGVSGKSQVSGEAGHDVASGAGVASLLKHSAVGVTADDARGRETARNASWTYDRIDVHCATLLLHRVK
ncbi:hypothetical protein ERJ75_000194100 [Trypanosoma vivax]|uniref:Uncharacterized protein n=1 Tax=Trypanosoma vivax (strain Y486) TaxID=1055687 RepID=G0UA35_TRYVY|nr:hypothetical protein TRVL_03128 [Trypanosoma vivax]KAH8619036.1 hypothetical protein ERJ75_000194100 [Trypanosoma vivax]CCC52667.1 conserved hypothetical protein [Trypanosoma vivax Y486]